jgi:hypothetical protein
LILNKGETFVNNVTRNKPSRVWINKVIKIYLLTLNNFLTISRMQG